MHSVPCYVNAGVIVCTVLGGYSSAYDNMPPLSLPLSLSPSLHCTAALHCIALHHHTASHLISQVVAKFVLLLGKAFIVVTCTAAMFIQLDSGAPLIPFNIGMCACGMCMCLCMSIVSVWMFSHVCVRVYVHVHVHVSVCSVQ